MQNQYAAQLPDTQTFPRPASTEAQITLWAPSPSPRPSRAVTPSKTPGRKGLQTTWDAANAAKVARRREEAYLSLRQDWQDEPYMREHLKVGGLKNIRRTEPASTSRVNALMKRAGVSKPEMQKSLGVSLERYLELNPLLPLWAATAFILELTGRFAPSPAFMAKVAA